MPVDGQAAVRGSVSGSVASQSPSPDKRAKRDPAGVQLIADIEKLATAIPLCAASASDVVPWMYAKMCHLVNDFVPSPGTVGTRLAEDQCRALSFLVALLVPPCARQKSVLVEGSTWTGKIVEDADGMSRLECENVNLRFQVDATGSIYGGTAEKPVPMFNLRLVSPFIWMRLIFPSAQTQDWARFWQDVDAQAVLSARAPGLEPLEDYLRHNAFCDQHGVIFLPSVRFGPTGDRGYDVELRYPVGDDVRSLRLRFDWRFCLPDGTPLSRVGDYLRRKHPHCRETADQMVDDFLR